MDYGDQTYALTEPHWSITFTCIKNAISTTKLFR